MYKDKYPGFYRAFYNHNTIELIDYCLDLMIDLADLNSFQYSYNGAIETLKICSLKLSGIEIDLNNYIILN
jgi:hypothetical protein